MAAAKPWESAVPMSNQPIPASLNNINQGFLPSIESPRAQGAPPPPPPRNNQSYLSQQQQQPMGLYSPSNYLSPYSMGSFYGQPGFGPMNNYRFSPYGPQGNLPVSNFAQLAMDESRSAFSSIESVIHTFRSISYMLESTFTSVYSSFRAVTDVIDHFTRVRTEITSIYPLVLIGRFLKYLYHRLLRLLHLRRSMPGMSDETWSHIYQSLQQNNAATPGGPRSSSSSLLVALFFLVSFGVPMLMLKLLNSIIHKRQDANNWLEKDTNPARVIALYDYVAQNGDELSFPRGTTIYLAPLAFQSSNSNWFLGTIDRIHTGLIPANYVQPVRSGTQPNITLHPQPPLNGTTSVAPSQPPPVSPLISTNNS